MSSSNNSSEMDQTKAYVCVRSIVLVHRSMISLNGTEEGFTKQRASINVCHLKVTSLVVIIVYSNKVRNNSICKCAPFAKFVKIIDHEHLRRTVFATENYSSQLGAESLTLIIMTNFSFSLHSEIYVQDM